jgi:anti-sigma regulatory factor (Ser/Thr protein kinase)
VAELCETLGAVNGASERGITIEHSVEPLAIGLEASVPLGLVLNELICNSLKHAFPHGWGGTIRVRLRRDAQGKAVLAVEDDGVGFAAQVSLERPTSLGLRLVSTLARQLGGQLRMSVRAAADPGTSGPDSGAVGRSGVCTEMVFDLDDSPARPSLATLPATAQHPDAGARDAAGEAPREQPREAQLA